MWFARIGGLLEGAFAGFYLSWLSIPAKVAVLVVVAGGIVLTVVVVVADFLSEKPSSTAPLIFPFMALYVGIAVGVIALLDRGVRRLLRK